MGTHRGGKAGGVKPEDLSGLMNPGIGEHLRALAAEVPADQCIVEIGSFRGKSTAFLASGSKGAKVYAVDPWDLAGNVTGRFGFADPSTREVFERQLRACRLWSKVTPIQAFSTDAAKEWSGPPIGLLFVDGDHTETAVRADLDAWSPHLAPGAVVAFDDYRTPKNPGVAAVVDTLTWPTEIVAGSLAVCRT